jgi:hypothetical protein
MNRRTGSCGVCCKFRVKNDLSMSETERISFGFGHFF